jgi:gas vesicle protein
MKGKSLFFGLLSGAVLGVLFAPDAGKKMREKMKSEMKKGGTGLSALKKSFVDMGHDILETVDDVRSKMDSQDEEQEDEKGVSFKKKPIHKSRKK